MIIFTAYYTNNNGDEFTQDVEVRPPKPVEVNANDGALWGLAAMAAVATMPDGAQILDTLELIECTGEEHGTDIA